MAARCTRSLNALLRDYCFVYFVCSSYGGSDAGAAGVDGRAGQIVGLVGEASIYRNAALRELEGALGRAAVAAAGHVRAAVENVLRTEKKMKTVAERKTSESQEEAATAARCDNNRGRCGHYLDGEAVVRPGSCGMGKR